MAYILVPVDFSTNSLNAYVYALSLAERFKLNIKVLHVYNRSFVPNEPMRFEGNESLEEMDEHKLAAFVNSCLDDPLYPDLVISPDITVDYDSLITLSAADGIRAIAEDDEVEMVVMGTSNKTGPFANWLGSTASAVCETVSKPVMLIPPNVTFADYRNIVVANHYETTDKEMLDQLANWAELFKATLHFVHVIQTTDHFPYHFATKSINEQYAARFENKPAFKIANVKDHSVKEGLGRYAETQGADLMIIVNKERSKWNALLKSSITQQLSLAAKIPLLVMHSEAFYQHR